jgi:hypothetical protein
MGDGLAAAIGAGEVLGGCGRGIRGQIAADEAGALGKAAGVAKHGRLPERSETIHRSVIAKSSDSRNFRNVFAPLPQKSLFVRIG